VTLDELQERSLLNPHRNFAPTAEQRTWYGVVLPRSVDPEPEALKRATQARADRIADDLRSLERAKSEGIYPGWIKAKEKDLAELEASVPSFFYR